MKHHYHLTSFLIFLICGLTSLWGQDLGELTVDEVPAGQGGSYVVRNGNEAILIVHSALRDLSFESNMGIRRVDNPDPGEYFVHLNPGTNIVTFKTDGYLPFKRRFYIDKKDYLEVKLKAAKEYTGGRGSLEITTDPSGAAVIFNNVTIADRTPTVLKNQPSGRFLLQVVLDGYATQERMITIRPDQLTHETFQLNKQYAELSVQSDPSGARVFLEGELLGTTPFNKIDLPPGDATLLVDQDGYMPNSQPVRLTIGKPAVINVYLMKQTGAIEVTTSPSGAEVFLDGVSIGVYQGSPLVKDQLEIGSHVLRASLDGYEEVQVNFGVNVNKTVRQDLVLTALSGSMFVMSIPKDAAIYLNDQYYNQTPFKIADLNPGQYNLKLTRNGYQDYTQSVTIAPAKTITVNATLEEAIQPVVTKKKKKRKIAAEPPPIDHDFRSGDVINGPLTGMVFQRIPAGTFTMGSPAKEQDRDADEGPEHTVRLQSFYIMDTEVTQAQWQAIMGENPSHHKGDNLPVEQINYEKVKSFIDKLNQKYRGSNFRLPTEAQWEYACRAHTTTRFYNGYRVDDVDRIGWHTGNSDSESHPVRQKQPNAWGLYDMAGNLWEYCEDHYHSDYNEAPTDGSAWLTDDPTNSYVVVRGGCYREDRKYCRSANRLTNSRTEVTTNRGFRLVRSPIEE